MTAEDVDEHRDQDPDPDHPEEELEHRPEKVQERIRRRRNGERHWIAPSSMKAVSPRREDSSTTARGAGLYKLETLLRRWATTEMAIGNSTTMAGSGGASTLACL